MNAKEKDAALNRFRKRLLHLDTTSRLYFHPSQDYAPNERLQTGVLDQSGFQHNIKTDAR